MSEWLYQTRLVYRNYSDCITYVYQQCFVLRVWNESGKIKCAHSTAANTGSATAVTDASPRRQITT